MLRKIGDEAAKTGKPPDRYKILYRSGGFPVLAASTSGFLVAMEYHFVPLEERARDEKGNILP
jgi:hypothetical protein